MHSLRRHLSFANVASSIALFVALGGGTAVALTGQNTVYSDDIVDGQVKTPDLANGGVTGSKLGDGAVTAAKIATSSIKSNHIVNGQVAPIDIKPAEGWHQVAAGSTSGDACADTNNVAVFCSFVISDVDVFPWKNFGGDTAPAAFYRDQLGIVHLRGAVVPPGWLNPGGNPLSLNIFRLPVGYRPSDHEIFSVAGQSLDSQGRNDGAAARVDVKPNGLVVDVQDCTNDAAADCAGNGAILSFSGIEFRP